MNEIKYIGIRGHRGSGKNTVAYLLANVIQFILDNYMTKSGLNMKYVSVLHDDPVFNTFYNVCCHSIKEDETKALEENDTRNVYLESFGDTPRILLQLITNIPSEYFNSDYYKDHVVVNLGDFSYQVIDDPSRVVDYDCESLLRDVHKNLVELGSGAKVLITLRELIIYFAQTCMKYLGQNVWVKSMRQSESNDLYEDYYNVGTRYKIFRDIKAPSELTYVKSHDGIIIKVSRPAFRKKNLGVETLKNDDRFDYELIIEDDITKDEKLKKSLIEIATKIIQ